MEEIWKDSPFFPKDYEVSDAGRVRRKEDGKMLCLTINKAGYHVVALHRKQFKVSRLIAAAFIPNPENKPYIDHINTIRTDNRVCNLRWCTHKENMNNPLTVEKIRKSKVGANNPNFGKVYTEEERILMSQHRKGKPLTEEWRRHKFENRFRKNVLQYSESGVLIKEWDSMTDASRSYGISVSKMSVTCNGIDKRPRKGYYWCFATDTERIKEIESLREDSSPKLF